MCFLGRKTVSGTDDQVSRCLSGGDEFLLINKQEDKKTREVIKGGNGGRTGKLICREQKCLCLYHTTHTLHSLFLTLCLPRLYPTPPLAARGGSERLSPPSSPDVSQQQSMDHLTAPASCVSSIQLLHAVCQLPLFTFSLLFFPPLMPLNSHQVLGGLFPPYYVSQVCST